MSSLSAPAAAAVWLHGRVLVTGAARGLGLAMCRHLLRSDEHPDVATVYATCQRRSAEIDELARTHGSDRLVVVEMDVTEDGDLERVAREIDRLDVVINNAGILSESGGSFLEADRAVWNRHFDVNMVSYAMVAKTFWPHLSRSQRPVLVNISGGMASIHRLTENLPRVPFSNLAYLLSKFPIGMFTRALAIAHPEVFTVAVEPGWINTDMGGPNARFSVDESTTLMLASINRMTHAEHAGGFFDRDGRPVPY